MTDIKIHELVFSELQIVSNSMQKRYSFELDKDHQIANFDMSFFLPARMLAQYDDVSLEVRRHGFFKPEYKVRHNKEVILNTQNSFQQLKIQYQDQKFYTTSSNRINGLGLNVHRSGQNAEKPILKVGARLKKLHYQGVVFINEVDLEEQFLQAIIAMLFYHIILSSQGA